jgi:hypothetical protein
MSDARAAGFSPAIDIRHLASGIQIWKVPKNLAH